MLWKKICAWCEADLGMVDAGERETDFKITHGICKDCRVFFTANAPASLHEFINRFEIPLFIVDCDGLVCTANKAAMYKLNKPLLDIEGQLGGDVFECVYARLPNGCGKTEHCVGCTIRRTVTETYETELGVEKRTALQILNTDKGPKKTRVLISTEKVNEIVILRIDSIKLL